MEANVLLNAVAIRIGNRFSLSSETRSSVWSAAGNLASAFGVKESTCLMNEG
jgi:hypothetical protein